MVSNIFYFHPYLGKIPILTNIFQIGWNYQPAKISLPLLALLCRWFFRLSGCLYLAGSFRLLGMARELRGWPLDARRHRGVYDLWYLIFIYIYNFKCLVQNVQYFVYMFILCMDYDVFYHWYGMAKLRYLIFASDVVVPYSDVMNWPQKYGPSLKN